MIENTGSFGAPIGGSSALVEAMNRRGIDASALQQVSPGSAGGAAPIPQPTTQLEGAQQAIAPETAQPQPTESAQPQNPELAIALEALGGFVKSEGQTRRDLVKGRMQGIV